MDYDVVYVGAGIACLYSAYKYKQKNPSANIIILEKSDHIGGRIDWDKFDGIDVVKGAAVGRFKKDKLLLSLLIELKIPYKIAKVNLKDDHGVGSCLKTLNSVAIDSGETFRELGIRALGETNYRNFVQATGYSDYEAMDARVALKHYGFDDTYGLQTSFIFSWEKLIDKISFKLKILKNIEVLSVNTGVVVTKNNVFNAKHVCVGVTLSGIKKLFPSLPIYEKIGAQPFMRIYAKLNKPLPCSQYTVVGGVFQKMIPIKDNVVMIAYADNANASKLCAYKKEDLQRELQKIVRSKFYEIKKFVKYFWKEGTHFYKPLDCELNTFIHNAQRPMDKVYVIGEVVSKNQGWANSALVSTTKINIS